MRRPSLAIVLAVGLSTLALAACSDDEAPAGTSGPGWTRLSPQALNDRMAEEEIFLVNVHVPDEGEIVGTDAHIPYTELADRLEELPGPGEATLVLYCRSGNMSTQAANELVAAGRTGFFELEGGYTAWVEAGLPFRT